jgi:L-alanine-DL-glutamate epimerase-like enolase superfamily enzyme
MDSDISIVGSKLYLLPVETRVPLKFGGETLTSVVCARVEIIVRNNKGGTATGWGETPLSVQWVWPSTLSYADRCDALEQFCRILCRAYTDFDARGHALEIGADFIDTALPDILTKFNHRPAAQSEPMPHLAALVCCSAFDIAVHDAFGKVNDKDIYTAYTTAYVNRDLSHFIHPADGSNVSFDAKYPADFLIKNPATTLPAWHLVGGKDPVDRSELTGSEPDDGYPVLLEDWIKTDGLKCLKVKLRGNDQRWDYDRLVKVGTVAMDNGAAWLSSDFNCTVTDPAYVNEILDRLLVEHPRIWQMILYVEQPFPYDLHTNRIDVHSVSARKPLFMDESAHDWTLVRLGRQLGWTGVALKTCKTQTGALLSLCWAKAHGMTLMVQDLTNPMLAQIPHVRLAAHAGTIMGVETNAMQFYPEASNPERRVHPGIYTRHNGQLDLATIRGPGFGYRLDEIQRQLPPVDTACEK